MVGDGTHYQGLVCLMTRMMIIVIIMKITPPPRGLHRKFLNRHVLSGLMVGDGTWRSVMLDDKSDDNRNDHEIHLIDENDDALKGVLGFGW